MLYYSTFPSGFEKLVARCLARELPGARATDVLDGGILYTTDTPVEEVRRTRLFQNSYIVLSVFRDLPPSAGLEVMLRDVGAGRTGDLEKILPTVGRTPFRLVTSDRNRLVHVERPLARAAEGRIRTLTGAPISREGARQEYWFLLRSEGIGLFLSRITTRRATKETLRPGELQPEVAHLLCCMSDPRPDDVFLDPFCGWGAIAAERLESYPFRSITALDLDAGKVQHVRERLRWHPGAVVTVDRADATVLEGMAAGSVSAVVTDPPWGLYERVDVRRLYGGFLRRVSILLRPGGVVVLLLSREPAGWEAIAEVGFDVAERYDILLSGKKASALRLAHTEPHAVSPAAAG